jgi:hypothetical protein
MRKSTRPSIDTLNFRWHCYLFRTVCRPEPASFCKVTLIGKAFSLTSRKAQVSTLFECGGFGRGISTAIGLIYEIY